MIDNVFQYSVLYFSCPILQGVSVSTSGVILHSSTLNSKQFFIVLPGVVASPLFEVKAVCEYINKIILKSVHVEYLGHVSQLKDRTKLSGVIRDQSRSALVVC